MAMTLDTIHKEIKQLQNDIFVLRHIMEEEYPLSNWASKALKKAREEMGQKNYVPHEEILAKYG